MSLSGAGHYDSTTGVLAVDGQLTVFGQNLIAGAIKVGSAGITLHTTLDLDSIASVPLGTTTLDFTLAYNPARLCGGGASSIKLPGTTTNDAKRIKDLEHEVRELKRANEILLAASSFFARELDPRLPW